MAWKYEMDACRKRGEARGKELEERGDEDGKHV